jgi:hypothetical protein
MHKTNVSRNFKASALALAFLQFDIFDGRVDRILEFGREAQEKVMSNEQHCLKWGVVCGGVERRRSPLKEQVGL